MDSSASIETGHSIKQVFAELPLNKLVHNSMTLIVFVAYLVFLILRSIYKKLKQLNNWNTNSCAKKDLQRIDEGLYRYWDAIQVNERRNILQCEAYYSNKDSHHMPTYRPSSIEKLKNSQVAPCNFLIKGQPTYTIFSIVKYL